MKESIKSFRTNGYVTVPYPEDVRRAVLTTAQAWKKFCALPLEVKQNLPYSNSSDGVGYECKNGIGNKADRKENFDVALAGREWLDKYIASIDSPVVIEFLARALSLVSIIKPMIIEFAQSVEKTFEVKNFTREIEEGTDVFFIRFNHYFGDRKIDEETGSAHPDQSGFTPTLFTSAPGLQFLTYKGKWIDVPISEKETIIIPAMQMQVRTKGQVKALWHRVIATPETAIEGRDSAVCFVQLKNTPKYNKAKFGRLQEMEPGFNYDMPFEEFAKFFV